MDAPGLGRDEVAEMEQINLLLALGVSILVVLAILVMVSTYREDPHRH